MRLPRNAKIFRGQLDVAPFAGVFFLLVILLLLQSSFVHTPGVRINLSDVGLHLPGAENPVIVVAIDSSGRLYHESQATTEDRLFARLKTAVRQSKEPITLVLQADKEGKLDVAVRVMNLARRAGIRETLVATEPKTAASGTNNAPPL